MSDDDVTQKPSPKAHPIHPETKRKTDRVPGDESSVAAFPGRPDGRTNDDKDGNAEQARTKQDNATPKKP